ncbi:hypothetical protein TSAR_007554 [Trichomalopsis sarcophagae]|uniref:Uncharacterized protein n=1 Tax=Trichomalopsis sarcophagae TaxID=543379 RepID=A0A232FEH5_9HYME|nr:hypothetical protein TSAR_007554 [Trichomalopsis sarcophagae]
MREQNTVGDFYDEINVLLSSVKNTLKIEKGEELKNEMMAPLETIAVDVFIKDLPANLVERVDYSKPNDLREAYEEAVRLETRMEAKIIPDSRPYRGRGQNYDNQDNYIGPQNGDNYRNYEEYRHENRYQNNQ